MNRARKLYEEIGAEAVLTKKSYLRLYLTGFESSAGYVLSDRDKDVFFTDSRYTEAARKQLAGSGIEVKEMERGMTIDDYLVGYKQLAIPFELTLYPEFKRLSDKGFALCNRCYLVNLKHVRRISGYSVIVADDEIQISRPQKKEFTEALKTFIKGGRGKRQ